MSIPTIMTGGQKRILLRMYFGQDCRKSLTGKTTGAPPGGKEYAILASQDFGIGIYFAEMITEKIHSKSVRFYVSGNNLFCFSPFKLWDPELDTDTGLRYPAMRSVMFGVDLNF